MVTEFLDPNSNITTTWNVFAYTNMDGGVRQPNAPNLDHVECNFNDDGELGSWGMTNTVQSYGEITEIKMWYYNHVNNAIERTLKATIKVGGVEETEQDLPYIITNQWRSLTFSGSWSAADVDNMEVMITQDDPALGFTTWEIFEMYAEITGTEGSAGTNMQINVSDVWKEVPAIKINIGDAWKEVVGIQENIGDAWKEVF